MVVVGVDPGISSPGAAAVRRMGSSERWPYCVLAARSITTDPKARRVERVWAFHDLVSELVREFAAELVAVEEQADLMAASRRNPGRVGFNASNHSTMATVGAAIGIARAYRVECMEIRKQTINVAVLGPGGGAAAEKRDVQQAVERLTGRWLSQAKADAVAAAIAGCQRWAMQVRARVSA